MGLALEQAGQRLFWPPNVAGWNDNRWLDTSPMQARWSLVTYALEGRYLDAWNGHRLHPSEAVAAASSSALAPG